MYSTVLVTLDAIPDDYEPNSWSHQVLDALQNLVWGDDSAIILSHIIPIAQRAVDIKTDRPSTEMQEIFEEYSAQLKNLQHKLPCASIVEVAQGDPAEEIIRLAKVHHADLIVMGCRGLTGFKRIVSRSVSAQVVEESSCSVWVVKPSAQTAIG